MPDCVLDFSPQNIKLREFSETIMQDSIQKLSEHERVSFKEFITLVTWVFKFVFRLVKANTIVYLITYTFRSFSGLINTYIIAKILDKIVEIVQTESPSISTIYPYLGVLLGFNILAGVISWTRTYSRRAIELRLRYRMERELYMKLQSLGTQTLERPGINNKISRAQEALYNVIYYFYDTVDIFASFVTLLVTIGLLLSAIPLVVPLVLLFSIPQFLYDKKYMRLAWAFGYKHTEDWRKASASSGDLKDPGTLQEILVSNAHKFLDRKFLGFRNWYAEASVDLRKKWFLGLFSFGVFVDLSVYTGYFMIFFQLFLKQITVGTVFFRINIVDRFAREIGGLLNSYTNLFERSLRMKDLHSLFIAEPAFADGTERYPKFELGPKVEIEDVTFSYPSSKKRVLNDVNLKIASGEKVAIVGHNGAGKTTLVKLLVRMYLPNKGSISVNDVDLRNVAIESLYQNVGVLFQDFNSYDHLSVKDNVAIGDTGRPFSEEDMVDALDRADALDFVNDYPNKFNQILSERYEGGVRPSTGQWQKIAIARFFYRNAPLVIFDEPTAAIDAVSEYNIFNKIYGFFEGKTVIIISHRFSTVRNADRIVVLEKGRIIEEGSHEELMKKNGYYAKSFKLQAEGYSIAG